MKRSAYDRGGVLNQMGRENFFKCICIGLVSLAVIKTKMLLLFVESMICLPHFFLLGDRIEVWKHACCQNLGRDCLFVVWIHLGGNPWRAYSCVSTEGGGSSSTIAACLHPQPAATAWSHSKCLEGSSACLSSHMTLQAHRRIKIQVYCNLYATTSSTSLLWPWLSLYWE